MMTWLPNTLIWGGAAVTLVGLGLLMVCMFRVARAKQANPSEEDLRDVLKSVVALNFGGLCLSTMGLIFVVVGLAIR
ncbi:MAG: hypothetical protein AB8B71_14715 [Paracoccaceae bacterium]